MEAKCGCATDNPGETPTTTAPPVDVVVVTSLGCHLCTVALAELENLAADIPMLVRTVDIGSPEGADIVRAHRPPAPPVVLVDGKFFSFGRLPRRKLQKLLAGRV